MVLLYVSNCPCYCTELDTFSVQYTLHKRCRKARFRQKLLTGKLCGSNPTVGAEFLSKFYYFFFVFNGYATKTDHLA